MPKEKDISNSELLEFIKDTVATKEDLKELATKEDVKKDIAESEKRVIDVIEKLSTKVKRVLDEDYPAQKKRISRVEFRTEKLLGNKLTTTDTDFEEKYRGEQRLTKQESGS